MGRSNFCSLILMLLRRLSGRNRLFLAMTARLKGDRVKFMASSTRISCNWWVWSKICPRTSLPSWWVTCRWGRLSRCKRSRRLPARVGALPITSAIDLGLEPFLSWLVKKRNWWFFVGCFPPMLIDQFEELREALTKLLNFYRRGA
jgi:hypothetical protein